MLTRIMILWIVLCTGPILAEVPQQSVPWKTNTPIVSVKKELYLKHPKPGAAALASDGYVGPKLERLEFQGMEIIDDVTESGKGRFSDDNGRTWVDFNSPPETQPDPAAQGVGGGPVVFDPNSGVLLGIGMRQVAAPHWNNFTYYRYSRDFGKTWTSFKQLRYEPGDDFDPKNPLKPSFLQRNQAYRGENILVCRNGTVVHCVGMANAPNDPDNDTRDYRLGGLCFVGEWDPQAKDYKWKAGKRVAVSADVSSRGLMEPNVEELTDERLLVIWRGSDTGKTPGRKWYSVSTDGGMTLSEPAELKYDDGSSFYSPSSWHLMIRHSVSKRLYWVGNICPEPPDGNWPRYPLVIAEIDEKIPALKRSTVTAIDDRQPGQSDKLQFSNFSLFEDRETHDMEMLMTVYGMYPPDVRTADCYKYFLTLK